MKLLKQRSLEALVKMNDNLKKAIIVKDDKNLIIKNYSNLHIFKKVANRMMTFALFVALMIIQMII